MSANGRDILVTGAGGFIGSHLAEALVKQQANVRAFVHYNSRNDLGMLSLADENVLHDVEIVAGNLCDLLAVRQAMDGCTTVFHLGAVISIPYSYKHPREVAETNLMGTLNVLQACRELKIERLVHTSSSEVYGTAIQVPIDEEHPLQGQSPYSASKIGADKLAESYFRAYDLLVVTVRPFNTYGPRQSARAVIPTIITQALTKDEISLGNLTPKRDLTFVSDTVDGFLKAGETNGIEGEVFNLGSGSEISIGELADVIVSAVGRNVQVVSENNRVRPGNSEVERLVADSSRARQQLNWRPRILLDEGLRRTIKWIEENIHLYDGETYHV